MRTAHNKGIPTPIETRIKISKVSGGRPFVSLLDGVVQQQFYTLKQAGDYYQVNRTRIHEALLGYRNRVRGHNFVYLDQLENK